MSMDDGIEILRKPTAEQTMPEDVRKALCVELYHSFFADADGKEEEGFAPSSGFLYSASCAFPRQYAALEKEMRGIWENDRRCGYDGRTGKYERKPDAGGGAA